MDTTPFSSTLRVQAQPLTQRSSTETTTSTHVMRCYATETQSLGQASAKSLWTHTFGGERYGIQGLLLALTVHGSHRPARIVHCLENWSRTCLLETLERVCGSIFYFGIQHHFSVWQVRLLMSLLLLKVPCMRYLHQWLLPRVFYLTWKDTSYEDLSVNRSCLLPPLPLQLSTAQYLCRCF